MIIQKELNILRLVDCELLSKVYINLIDQKEPVLNFKNMKKINLKIEKNILYFKKIVKPSDDEKKNHKKLSKK